VPTWSSDGPTAAADVSTAQLFLLLEMTPGGGGSQQRGAEGLEFVDDLKRDISSFLLQNAEAEAEDDVLGSLVGVLCYSRPEVAGEDRWRAARAESVRAPCQPDAEQPAAATAIFGAPPRSTDLRWPPRPEQRPSLRSTMDCKAKRCRSLVSPASDGDRSDSHSRNSDTGESDDSAEPLSASRQQDGQGDGARPRRHPCHRTDSSSSSDPPSPAVQTPLPQVDVHDLLEFTSCFESSNLQYVVYNDEQRAYDLILENDLHTRGHTQWFYFAMRNGRVGQTVRLRIVNMSKAKSLFRVGMKPMAWSEAYAAECERRCLAGGSAATEVRITVSELWLQVCGNVRYRRSRIGRQGTRSRFYTLELEYTFERELDCVFFAYCVPFTYSMLRSSLSTFASDPEVACFFRSRCLCRTLGNVSCDIVEISNWKIHKAQKKAVMVSARVHPGESNASWLVHGLMEFLVSASAEAQVLRDNFIWRIVPMLNPDGVICGNYRCGLCGVDLNRQWRHPHEELHNTVYKVKRLIKNLKKKENLCLYIDLHGHSRKCGIFSYACANYPKADYRRFTVRLYPKLLSMLMPEFRFGNCRWRVGKGKRGTGRVVVSKDLGLTNTYTIEASFFGAPFKGFDSPRDPGSARVAAPHVGNCDDSDEGHVEDSADVGRAASPEVRQAEAGQMILFTPAKLECFGVNLARALLLQQNLGPAVERARMRAAAAEATSQWEAASLDIGTVAAVGHGTGAGTDTDVIAGSGLDGPPSGTASEDSATATPSEVSDAGDQSSPEWPISERAADGCQQDGSRAGSSSPCKDDTQRCLPSLVSLPVEESVISDMPHLGIDAAEVLASLQEHPLSSTEPDSPGSESDPSEDNLCHEELARLSRLFAHKRKPSHRIPHKVCGVGGPTSSSAGSRGKVEGSGSGGGHGAGGGSVGASSRHRATKGRSRRERRGAPGLSPAATRLERRGVAPDNLQRTVAFGQTTYLAHGSGQSAAYRRFRSDNVPRPWLFVAHLALLACANCVGQRQWRGPPAPRLELAAREPYTMARHPTGAWPWRRAADAGAPQRGFCLARHTTQGPLRLPTGWCCGHTKAARRWSTDARRASQRGQHCALTVPRVHAEREQHNAPVPTTVRFGAVAQLLSGRWSICMW